MPAVSPALDDLLRQLTVSGVVELALASGRLPCIKDSSGIYVPIAQQAIDAAMLETALVESGGGPAVQALTEKPVSWTHRVPGLGVVTAVAMRRGAVIQARFVLTSREAQPASIPDDDPVSVAPPSSGMLEQHAAIGDGAPSAPRAPLPSNITIELDVPPPRAIEERAQPARRLTPIPVKPVREAAEIQVAPTVAIPSILSDILAAARAKSASDVHIVAERPTSFRVGGALVPQAGSLSAAEVAAILQPIVPPRLAPSLVKSGSCDFALLHPELGRFRVNIARQRTGLKGCFRLVSREVLTLAELGLPPTIGDATHHHQGLVLVTGPTGSGKSTTLAALVDMLNRETTHHIVTIEDPIEHIHPKKKALLSQREVGTHTKTFEAALKAALREDPDVIAVGELRDAETVRMALTASETGHLVVATMNTPSAAKTIERLIDLFPAADQGQVRMTLAGGLRLIVGQRLVPSLQGGMVAAAEMLTGCVPLWSLIRENRTFQIPSLQQRGKQLGIVRLDDQLMDLVRGGRISMEAARYVAESPDTLGK